METAVKEEDPIYISSDSDSEDITQTSIAVPTGGSVMDDSSSAQSAKRHCVDGNHVTQQPRYPPPVVAMVAPQPCFTRAPPPNHPRGPIHTPAPPYLREDPPSRDTAPISDQGPPSSSHWQVLRTSIGVFVVCPVCKSRARSGLLLEHMKEHRYQTTEWGKFRACQLCMD